MERIELGKDRKGKGQEPGKEGKGRERTRDRNWKGRAPAQEGTERTSTTWREGLWGLAGLVAKAMTWRL